MSAIANGGILYGAEPKIEQIVNGDNSVEITYAEYKALSEEEKKNGTTYYVPDVESVDITNILDTKADIEANTDENKIAGALAVKEVIEEVTNKFDFVDISENLLVVNGVGSSLFQITARECNKHISISFGVEFTESKPAEYVAKINKAEYCPQVLTAVTTIGVESSGVYREASGFVLTDGRIYFRTTTACSRAYYNIQYDIQ